MSETRSIRSIIAWAAFFFATFAVRRLAIFAVHTAAKRFDFESIPVIEMAAVEDGCHTCREVGGQEQWPPCLALTDVHPLVRTRRIEQFRVPGDHDVPERHGGRSAGERRHMRQ
jgi:hypothetical protein